MAIIVGPENRIFLNLGWNSSTDSYTATTTKNTVTAVHLNMRRCVLNLNGTVNYYLDPTDSTKKADGTSATLTGADGYVMVEIPKFSFKYSKVSNQYVWDIALGSPQSGYTLHPAFVKDGVEVNYRYIGAYDACFWDATDSTYKSGLNLDNASGIIDTNTDKLASVSGIYPLVGITRNEARLLAAKNGTGWRQLDFWLASAVQLLYLTEYGTFNSQAQLGAGNTAVTNAYTAPSSSVQTDSPHSVAGKSNSLGNASTNTTTGASSASRDTAFMSYRGIENFYGNCWNWVDGLNIISYAAWATNNSAHFVDNVTTNLTNIGTVHNAGGWATDIVDYAGAFLPSAVGGSSSTKLTDYYYINSGNRVAFFGGSAALGSSAGVFLWALDAASSIRDRSLGARACF